MADRRRYQLRVRARRQEETRRRIVDAAVALHREVGPARTTVAEIARRAGVGRVTVYNHFPDEAALLGACWARFVATHPPPDPSAWRATADPRTRLRSALRDLYSYYRRNEAMLAHATRDARLVPALGALVGGGEAAAHREAMRDALLAGRGLRGDRRRRVRAVIGLALDFATWRRLVREEGLSDGEAVEALAQAVGAV